MSEQQGATPAGTEPADTGSQTPDAPLGESGIKALQSEREARKQLEAELGQFRQGLAALAGGDAKSSDPLAALTARFDQMQTQLAESSRALQVAEVARENGISDPDDLRLLKSATDDATLSLLVSRLKAHTAPNTQPPPGPRPDLTQGGGGGEPIPLNGTGIESAVKQALGIA